MRHGSVFERYQYDGRPFSACRPGHLLRRAADQESAAGNDRKGDQSRTDGRAQSHLGETEKQISRLEQVFDLLGEKAKGATCPAIDGIIKEAREIAGEVGDKKVLDAALIAAAQAVEHYEITRYGTLIAWAEELGKEDVAKLLTTTLKEERAADKKLSGIAEKKVNLKAAG